MKDDIEKLNQALELLYDAILQDDAHIVQTLEQALKQAVQEKYGVSGLHFGRFMPDHGYRHEWICTSDDAYKDLLICASELDLLLHRLAEGVGEITFLDTSVKYTNLEDLRKDILTIKLAQV